MARCLVRPKVHQEVATCLVLHSEALPETRKRRERDGGGDIQDGENIYTYSLQTYRVGRETGERGRRRKRQTERETYIQRDREGDYLGIEDQQDDQTPKHI